MLLNFRPSIASTLLLALIASLRASGSFNKWALLVKTLDCQGGGNEVESDDIEDVIAVESNECDDEEDKRDFKFFFEYTSHSQYELKL